VVLEITSQPVQRRRVPARNPHVLAAIGVVPVGVCGPSDDRCDLTTNEAHSPRDPDGRVQHRTIAGRAIATGTGYARDDDEAHALIRTALGGAGGHHPRPRPGHAPTSGSTRYRHQARDATQFP
jgi:hypothetical protein